MEGIAITIVARDINGKHIEITGYWSEISLKVCENTDLHDEILLVIAGGTCIFSSLGSKPITWDDIIGFFA